MTLQIDMSFTIQKTADERLAELEAGINALFELWEQNKITVAERNYEVAAAGHERMAIIQRQAEQKRRQITRLPVENVP